MPSWAQNRAHGPSTVTIDMVLHSREGPQLTKARLLNTPDDQVIFFWAEVAQFTLSGPVEEENTTFSKDHHWFYYEIHDESGQVVGKTDYCSPEDADDETIKWARKQSTFDFVHIGTNAAPHAAVQKVVLQVFWEDGIAYRISGGDILEDAWSKSKPQRRLIAMG